MKRRVIVEDDGLRPPPGMVTASTLANKGNKVMIVSNDSSYLEQEIGSVAWIIRKDDGRELTVCFLM